MTACEIMTGHALGRYILLLETEMKLLPQKYRDGNITAPTRWPSPLSLEKAKQMNWLQSCFLYSLIPF
jgi:hypothetical protein